MVHYLITIIMIIMGFVITIISGPIAIAYNTPGNKNLISEGRYNDRDYIEEAMKRISGGGRNNNRNYAEEVLKMIMPPKRKGKTTFADVLRMETDAIRADPPEFDMNLNPSAPRLPYRRRLFDIKGTKHWGQLKLMLSEIDFLSAHGQKAKTVVYAGAAPGTHIGFLSMMFPEHKFILWDPRAFNVKESDKIEIHQEYFTDESAKLYADYDGGVLFISDIRTGDTKDAECDFEGRVSIDMEWQKKWHEIIRPKMAMYKFRLPYASGKTEYMDGIVRLQVFAPTSTTELRLWVEAYPGTKIYDNDTIEEQMYHFNYFTRPRWFGQQLRCCHLDGCWDCTAMVTIINTYLNNIRKIEKPTKTMVTTYVKKIIEACARTNKLNTPPHGDGSNVDWFARADKYNGTKIVDGTNRKESIKKEHLDAYIKIVADTKKAHPDLIYPAIIS